jgi:hypothetical protein
MSLFIKYACGTAEICPRPLPQTGEVMSLRLIGIICVFFSYYSHYNYLYPCRQREGLVRKYLFFSISFSFGQYISVFWPLRCLAVAHSIDHWPVTTEDPVQFQAIGCWICGWHSDIGTCCLLSVSVYFASVIQTILQNYLSPLFYFRSDTVF